MIPCSLMPIQQNSLIHSENSTLKYGQYLSSYFHIKGYGKKCWVVAVNIEIDHNLYLAQGHSPESLVGGCIEHLNFPPKSKYGKKRRRQPLYGKFRGEPYSFKMKTKNGKQIKYFWGEGQKANYSTWRRKKQL